MKPSLPLLTGLALCALASPAQAENRPGSLDVGALVGGIIPDEGIGLEPNVWYGGQITHHFQPFDAENPWGSLAFRASWEGALLYFPNGERIDFILIGAVVMWKLAPTDFMEVYLGTGAGFLIADGTPSGNPLVPRTVFQPTGGVLLSPAKHFFMNVELRAMIHENIPFGVVGVTTGDVAHFIPTFSFGGRI